MPYAHSGPAWIEIAGPFVLGDGAEALSYPANWPDLASAEEREAAGLALIVEPDTTPPDGQAFQGWTGELVDVDGAPTRVALFDDVPLPAEVPMYKVRKYLIREGLMTAVQTFLDGLPGTEGEEARSDFDYAPNFVVGGPLALGAKAALGLDDEQWAAAVLAANAIA